MWKKIKERVLYRITQFFRVLSPKIDPLLLAEAESLMPKTWGRVFHRLLPSDQAHALRLYRKIRDTDSLSEKNKQDLLLLALVHDIGKIITRPALWERILKGLLPIPNLAHPHFSGKILRQLGAPKHLITRVKNHHRDPGNDELLRLFQTFDNSS